MPQGPSRLHANPPSWLCTPTSAITKACDDRRRRLAPLRSHMTSRGLPLRCRSPLCDEKELDNVQTCAAQGWRQAGCCRPAIPLPPTFSGSVLPLPQRSTPQELWFCQPMICSVLHGVLDQSHSPRIGRFRAFFRRNRRQLAHSNEHSAHIWPEFGRGRLKLATLSLARSETLCCLDKLPPCAAGLFPSVWARSACSERPCWPKEHRRGKAIDACKSKPSR